MFHRTLLRSLAILMTLPLFASLVHGQQANENPLDVLQTGSWALQFGMAGNLSLTTFQGSVVSAKYHRTSSRAWRFGVIASGGSTEFTGQEIRREELIFEQDPGSDSEQVTAIFKYSEGASSLIGVDAQVVFYPTAPRRLMPYWGIGPVANLSRQTLDEEDFPLELNPGRDVALMSQAEVNTLRLGAGGVAGIEWFAASGFSLSAEYVISVEYDHSKVDLKVARAVSVTQSTGTAIQTFTRSTSEKLSGVTLSSSTVRFGISVYF